MDPLIQGHSGTAPETSRNVFSISQWTNEDDSQSNPHPKVGLFNNQMTQNSGPKDGHETHQFPQTLEEKMLQKLSNHLSETN